MDIVALTNTLQSVQNWRNQLAGLGLIPPDVSSLIEMLRNVDDVLKKKQTLEAELASLETNYTTRRGAQEASLRKQYDTLKASLDSDIKQYEASLARVKKEYETQEAAAKASIQELDRILNNRQQELSEIEARLNTLRTEYDTFKAKVGV